jgi:N4-gp56 family major capsid protein
MSSSITNTSVLPPAVRDYYDRVLLMTAFPYLIHTKYAQRRNLPEKSGDTMVFRRYTKLDPVPIALVDGITPPGAPLSVTDIKAQVSFYGNFVTITNQVQLTVEDRTMNEAAELLAQNLGQTLDQVTRDVLLSGLSSVQCAFGVNGQTPTEITASDFDVAVQTLLNNDCRMVNKAYIGTDQFGTTPIRPSFWCYMDTALIDDLEDVSSFVSTANYPGSEVRNIQDAEWGSVRNIKIFITSAGSVTTATVPVYNNFIGGQEAYGIVNLGSAAGRFYVKPLGSAGSADPLNQRGTVGWLLPFVARILNDNFYLNLQATHS